MIADLWWEIKKRRWTIAVVAAAAAIAVAAVLDSSDSDEGADGELSHVELAPPRLLDDGAGQRHFEVSYPDGQPRATMIFIHGGGWTSHSQATFSRLQPAVNELTDAGFRVVAISTDQSPALSRPGAPVDGSRVLDDVLAFYDQAADAFPEEPICAYGISGGGHLSLMLAVERRELACVAAIGPPTDLVSFAREGGVEDNPGRACARPVSRVQIGACYAAATWGVSKAALRQASPALRWPNDLDTRVWAGFEQDDPVIPDSQREALEAGIPRSEIEVLRNDPNGPGYAHSGVRAEDKRAANRSVMSWLDEVVPPVPGSAELPDEDLVDGTHTACNSSLVRGAPWRTGRRRDRSELLTAAGRWRPQADSALVSAISSCDGREDLQESGLSLSVPAFTAGEAAYVRNGERAAWVFEAPEGSAADSLTASFRGFFANPGVWRVALYERRSGSDDWAPIAECDGLACDQLDLQPAAIGVTVVPSGTPAGAEQRASLPEQTFELDRAGQIKWELACVARRGCLPRSINPGSDPAAPTPRRRVDPTGRPAVFSLYELEVTTSGE